MPLLAKERDGLENIVFAGGVCTVNPEPLADFIDFFSIGEGEESTPQIIECYRAAKRARQHEAGGISARDREDRGRVCAVAVHAYLQLTTARSRAIVP